MATVFDSIFDSADVVIGNYHGEAVEYTYLDQHTVTDEFAFIDCIESGYEVDGGIRTSQDERGDESGIVYENKRTFALRKSAIGEAKPEIHATLRVVAEGDNADVWTVWRIAGSDAQRWVIVCERPESHERSRGSYRSR